LFRSADIDARELRKQRLDESLFEDYAKQRVVNSFLFNFMKIQDRIGAKLFRRVLFELKELDDESVPMRDILDRLEKLRILPSVERWERLREIRNAVAHEYPLDIEERVENITLALEGYEDLKAIFRSLERVLAPSSPKPSSAL
jgi:hypothetical protein